MNFPREREIRRETNCVLLFDIHFPPIRARVSLKLGEIGNFGMIYFAKFRDTVLLFFFFFFFTFTLHYSSSLFELYCYLYKSVRIKGFDA